MQNLGGRLVFSPSDLNNFLECEHLTTLDLQRCLDGLIVDESDDAEAELRRRLGIEHERAWLAKFVADGKRVVAIGAAGEDWDSWCDRAAQTVAAMREGADVIYQAVFVDNEWRGIADFLVRVPMTTGLGEWGYEAWDTKLGRHAKPTYAIQLAFYTDQIARVQGKETPPKAMHVVLGNNLTDRLDAGDYLSYYRALRRRFTTFVERPFQTSAYPVEHCGVCRYRAVCDESWRGADRLCLVCGIRRETVFRLEKAGVETMAALASCDSRPDSRISEPTFEALREQARLQRSFMNTGLHSYELIDPSNDRGFALLPPPSPGDLFFDMEGYPYFEPAGGLEYLFGVSFTEGSARRYQGWRATDRAEEKLAFEHFIDFVRDRLRLDPALHVYHYASYERTKLGQLAQLHATREEELDDLLRRQVFVDLYKVTRQAIRTSHEGYSLKDVRQFFSTDAHNDANDGDAATVVESAGDSIVAFSKWMQSGDSSILDAIENYNEEDCVSTSRLRDWLLERRLEAVTQFGADIPWRPPPTQAQPTVEDISDPHAELRRALFDSSARSANLQVREALALLAGLVDYHRREDKPEWWEHFDRLDMSMQELTDDPGAIVGLEPIGQPSAPIKPARSWAYDFQYPEQEHGFDVGDSPLDFFSEAGVGTVAAAPQDEQRISLRIGAPPGTKPLPRVIIAQRPVDSNPQRQAVRRVAEYLCGHPCESVEKYQAIADLLTRRPPRLRGRPPGGSIQTTSLSEQRALVADLDRSVLVIQGPPGSGKTWTGARLIATALRSGARVGVAAFSHRAIANLLEELERVADEDGLTFRGVKKSAAGKPDSEFHGRCITSESDKNKCLASGAQLLAGTPFFFPYCEGEQFDYIFLDEAGQLSLGDAVAIGAAARNLVLLGDPQQLPQVSHGIHPAGAGASVLEHYLNGAATVPRDRGVFLETTFRMHPDICRFISALSYDGRLEADASCTRQRVESDGLSGTGLRYLPVEHRGNARLAVEEAVVVAGEVETLLRSATFTNRFGVTRPLQPTDILVVSPYNMQRRCLRERLPPGVEVGTVDKFQGREAAIVFFSMATSSGDDLPRNVEFLFSKNRLNVAVSRARCLSVLVASPRLLDVRCRTLQDVARVNGLCKFVEMAAVAPVRPRTAPVG